MLSIVELGSMDDILVRAHLVLASWNWSRSEDGVLDKALGWAEHAKSRGLAAATDLGRTMRPLMAEYETYSPWPG
jgi:hypothetical protein